MLVTTVLTDQSYRRQVERTGPQQTCDSLRRCVPFLLQCWRSFCAEALSKKLAQTRSLLQLVPWLESPLCHSLRGSKRNCLVAMALLAANRFASVKFVVRQARPAEYSHAPIAPTMPIAALRASHCARATLLPRKFASSRVAVAFEHPVSRHPRRRTLRRGVISMAMNDNQGSSGDMLHADDDFREAAVVEAGKPNVILTLSGASNLLL